MTRIKLCGLSRPCDIEAANELKPEYIGFVFAPGSRRCITPEKAARLKQLLIPDIQTVGVFVEENPGIIAQLLNKGIIDIVQLHGREDENYIRRLRTFTDKPIIKAFRIDNGEDVTEAEGSSADFVLLDSGSGGTGRVFDWGLIRRLKRPCFVAGGLNPENVKTAVDQLHPYAVDVSSGIETDGCKDRVKMAEFVAAVRKDKVWRIPL